jgi:DNA-binding transcriptional regulator YiaG
VLAVNDSLSRRSSFWSAAFRFSNQAQKSLAMNQEHQQEPLRKARKQLGLTNEQLAGVLNVSVATLIAHLAPESAAKHRRMKAADKLLLRVILAAKKGRG